MPHPNPEVKVGQICKNCDTQGPGRYFQVMHVLGSPDGSREGFAQMRQVVKNKHIWEFAPRALQVRVATKLLVPNATGYVLVEDVQ